MEPILIFGHRNPDTDSVCSAIAYAELKKELGLNAEARVIGHLNNESKFVLEYFKVTEPTYLSDVKIQIKDVNYSKGVMINQFDSIYNTINYMIKKQVKGIPVVNNSNEVIGYMNLTDVTNDLVNNTNNKLNSSYKHILETINGQEVLKFDEIVEGIISTFFEEDRSFSNIVITIDEEKIKYALEHDYKLVILHNSKRISSNLLKDLKKKEINVVTTSLPKFDIINKIRVSNCIDSILNNRNPYCVDRFEYREDFMKKSRRLKYTNYPVVNNKNECVGLLELNDLRKYTPRKVVLMDHNQYIQSVEGIEEAEILEVIDHHNIGNIATKSPINFRIMPVGSTCTIVYTLYQENQVKIPKNIAGILLSGIISDTLSLTSPTTTKIDIEVAKELAKRCKVDIKKYSLEMFKVGSSLKDKTVEEVLLEDYKEFVVDEEKVFVSHVISLDIEGVKAKEEEYIAKLNELALKDYKIAIVMITDISKKGSYVFYDETNEDVVIDILNVDKVYQGIFIKGLVSRKKQLVPNILENL